MSKKRKRSAVPGANRQGAGADPGVEVRSVSLERKPADAEEAGSLNDEPWAEALLGRLHDVWERAGRERAEREAKWQRNRLTSEAELAGEGDGDDPAGDGGWRNGDGKCRERLRVARQKVLSARSTIGDAVYRGNRVPFMLSWRDASPDVNDSELGAIRRKVDLDLVEMGAPDVMRLCIETGATFGEYWLHGGVSVDAAGGMRALVEAPSPWEMFFDDLGASTDLDRCEYVVRRRLLSSFELGRLVRESKLVDRVAAREILAGGPRRGAGAGGAAKRDEDSGRTRREGYLVEVREYWLSVPAVIFDDPEAARISSAMDERTPWEWVEVMALEADGRLLAVVREPGPRPYFRAEWDRDPMRSEPQGVLDLLEGTQATITGVVRAWLKNLRRGSRITLAGARDLVRQDVKEIIDGVDFIDLDPDARDVREALQQFRLDDLTPALVSALGFLLDLADLESNLPRLLQGQEVPTDATAYEIRERLKAAGKYLNEIVRRHDAAIVWLVGWWLYVQALAGAVPSEAVFAVLPRGFANFQELIARLEGLLRLIGLGGQSPEIGAWLNHEYLVRQVAQADEIDPDAALLSAEEYQAQQQAQAESEERSLALADARARVAKTEAEAESRRADAEAKRGRGTLDRAKFVRDVERDVEGGAG